MFLVVRDNLYLRTKKEQKMKMGCKVRPAIFVNLIWHPIVAGRLLGFKAVDCLLNLIKCRGDGKLCQDRKIRNLKIGHLKWCREVD